MKENKQFFKPYLACFARSTFSSATRLSRGRVTRLKSDNFTCCHTGTKRGDHDSCLSRSHYTDTDQQEECGPKSGDRTHGLLMKSQARPTEFAPPPPHTHTKEKKNRISKIKRQEDTSAVCLGNLTELSPGALSMKKKHHSARKV